jgi:hypothetical protein
MINVKSQQHEVFFIKNLCLEANMQDCIKTTTLWLPVAANSRTGKKLTAVPS